MIPQTSYKEGVIALYMLAMLGQVRAMGLPVSDIDGKSDYPLEIEHRGAVFIFTIAECPNANKSMPEINRLVKEYDDKKLKFYLVDSDSGIEPKKLKKQLAAFGYKGKHILLDSKHTLANLLGATTSPEAILMDPKGFLAYRGRIDDRFPKLGVERAPRSRDLKTAIDQFLAGKKVTVSRTPAVGCVLPKS